MPGWSDYRMETPSCYLCGTTTKELRPYGLNGQPICFGCMTSDPKRETEARAQIDRHLSVPNAVGYILGSEAGPIAILPKENLQ